VPIAAPLLDAARAFTEAARRRCFNKQAPHKFMIKQLALTTAVASLLACVTQAQTPVELKDLKQKASYAIGAEIAANLKQQEIEIDPQALAAGVADALAGKMKLTDAELKEVMNTFRTETMAKMESRQKVAGEKNLKDGEAFLAANAKKEGVKATASGLQYKVSKSGSGKSPKATDSVKVHYHGTLLDGTVFDSSVERGMPITFPLNGVIPGWTEALQLMKEGDKWTLYIPSKLAYGERGPGGKIGPNSTLIFEVELLAIEASN
jgi:FKBP-type peptidyl-prolyl cis-trans isomerase FklB